MPDPDRRLGTAAVAWARALLDALPAEDLAALRARYVEPALAALVPPSPPCRRSSSRRRPRSRPATYPRAHTSRPRSSRRPPSR